ncbi:MAG: hypothetical protein JNK05_31955 [Myxococcales bacterium]|nr:hypothetical protein [Myxococcales bacterium]
MRVPNELPLDGIAWIDGGVECNGERLRGEAFEQRFPDARGCDHCGRVYPSEVEWVGAPIDRCIHCEFEDLYRLRSEDEQEFFARLAASEELPELARYLRRYGPEHDTSACGRRPHCFLCDATQSGAPMRALGELRAWLAARGLTRARARTAVIDAPSLRRSLRAWENLSEDERLAVLDAVRIPAMLPVAVGLSRAGQPALLHRESGLELVVVPKRGAMAPFLLASTPLSRRQAAVLGATTGGDALDLPWTGFEIERLPTLFRWGFRLPSEREWLAAFESSAGALERFVCDGAALVSVLRADAPVNELGLYDMAGHVAELIDVQATSVVTMGGSASTERARLEPASRAAPKGTTARVERVVRESHAIRPLGGLLASVVPECVGVRLALSV